MDGDKLKNGDNDPKKVPLKLELDPGVPEDIHDVQKVIKDYAEKRLYKWSYFPIELPPSLTEKYYKNGDGSEQPPLLNFNDLFVAPSFDELEECATDENGDIKRLNSCQLTTVRQRGEFDVTSKHFPGQVHTWRVTQLLQKGTERTRNTMLNDAALALKLIIVVAKNRIISRFFSVSESGRAIFKGVKQLADLAVGLPYTTPGDLDYRLHEEHMEFLVAELDVTPSSQDLWSEFCDYVRVKWRESRSQTRNTLKFHTPMPPYKLQTAKGQEIDLRLFNRDVMRRCRPVLQEILDHEGSGWYVKFKDKLIAELLAKEISHDTISERVSKAVKEEYLKRVFEAVTKCEDLEDISPELGALLVREARSTLIMETALTEAQVKLEQNSQEFYLSHCKCKQNMDELQKNLQVDYPVRSRIEEWKQEKLLEFKREFVAENQWAPYENAMEMCRTAGLDQAVYFLQRDLVFMRDREPILSEELSKVRNPTRTFRFAQRIWFPGNWVVKRVMYGETEVIPTVIVEEPQNSYTNIDHTDGQPVYILEKDTDRQNSTKAMFWRWRNYFLRTWVWTWNAMFWLGVGIPWCGPTSFRALCYQKPFIPALELNHRNGTLQPQLSSKTETLRSRLTNVWESVSRSRAKFEAEPEKGFLGKGFTRHVNRFWNYVIKGALGSCALLFGFAPLCVLTSVGSILLAGLTPFWIPFVTFIAHVFMLLIYDVDKPGKGNGIMVLFEAIVFRLLIQGMLQPIAALFTAGVVMPISSAVVMLYALIRRSCREAYDALMFHLVIKKQSRTPIQDTFVARRIAGPGLAANYFFQAKGEQILAAVESHMEQSELVAWEGHIKRLVDKPLQQYRLFVSEVFEPFCVDVVREGVYDNLSQQSQELLFRINDLVHMRKTTLHTGLNKSLCEKIKLPGRELISVRAQTAQMLQDFFPKHVFSRLLKPEFEFWESRQLENGDWNGLATQVLTEVFSSHFLTPLEEADTVFRLEIKHLDLNRYVDMLADANVHDDLDEFDTVHTPHGDIDVDAPYFSIDNFSPLKTDVGYAEFLRKKRQTREWPWTTHTIPDVRDLQKLQIPLPILHPAFIALLIYNRENDQYQVDMKDMTCRRILHAAENTPYTDNPDIPMTMDAPEESSTPGATTTPSVSEVGMSHLAEQEVMSDYNVASSLNMKVSFNGVKVLGDREISAVNRGDGENVYDVVGAYRVNNDTSVGSKNENIQKASIDSDQKSETDDYDRPSNWYPKRKPENNAAQDTTQNQNQSISDSSPTAPLSLPEQDFDPSDHEDGDNAPLHSTDVQITMENDEIPDPYRQREMLSESPTGIVYELGEHDTSCVVPVDDGTDDEDDGDVDRYTENVITMDRDVSDAQSLTEVQALTGSLSKVGSSNSERP